MSQPSRPRTGSRPTSEFSRGCVFVNTAPQPLPMLGPEDSYEQAFSFYLNDGDTRIVSLLDSHVYTSDQQWEIVHSAAVDHQHEQANIINTFRNEMLGNIAVGRTVTT